VEQAVPHQQILEVGSVKDRRVLRVNEHKVFVINRARVGLLPERCTRGLDIDITIDVATEGGAPCEINDVYSRQCHHATRLPTEQGDDLVQTGGRLLLARDALAIVKS
jgi:hypothetical protein